MKLYIKVFVKYILNYFNLKLVRKLKVPGVSYESYPDESLRSKRFYNIGAGSFYHPLWTNIDYATEHYKSTQGENFIHYNLMELVSLPIKENSAEIVYSSHTIEHVDDKAVLNMLKEAYRILKPGGCIRLTTPDANIEYEAYVKEDWSFWHWKTEYYSRKGKWERSYKRPLSEASIEQLFLHHFASQVCEIDTDNTAKVKYSDAEIKKVFSDNCMEEGLKFFTEQCSFNAKRPGNHINWWNYNKISSLLKEAGFRTVYRSGYGQSLYSPLRDTDIFDNTHPSISLYVEAIK